MVEENETQSNLFPTFIKSTPTINYETDQEQLLQLARSGIDFFKQIINQYEDMD